jgi:hypothetical protein
VQRAPTRDEEKLVQVSRFTAGLSRTLQLLGGLGALTALVAGAAALAGRPASTAAVQSVAEAAPR